MLMCLCSTGDTNNSVINATGSIEHKAPLRNHNEKVKFFDPNKSTKKKIPPDDVIGNLGKVVKQKYQKPLLNLVR
jgi:hypothetical protein